MDKWFSRKYNDSVVVSRIQSTRPQLKFTGLHTGTLDASEIKDAQITQNESLQQVNFNITSTYKVISPTSSYVNAIIDCDLETHTSLLERRTFHYGLSTIRAYEQVNIIKCNKCLDYGHLARHCNGVVHCRRCANEHHTTECTSEALTCFNCKRSNQNGSEHDTNHSTSHACCPSRIERINGLKAFYFKAGFTRK